MHLSIIVPIYNVEEYLAQCLDSLYAIEGVTKEIILVNDGSTDCSLAIAEQYTTRFFDITMLIDQENGGLSAARNSGIKVAKGEFIAFVDSDDKVNPSLLVTLLGKAQTLELDIAIGRIESFGARENWNRKLSQKALDLPVCNGKTFLQTCLQDSSSSKGTGYKFSVNVGEKIYKNSFLASHNLSFKDRLLHEDALFTPQAIFKAEKVKLFDIPFYHYRQDREGSIMNTMSFKNYQDRLYIAHEVATLYYMNGINTLISNNRLISRVWPGLNNIFNPKWTKNITFKTLNPVLRLKYFGLKEYIKIVILLFICVFNFINFNTHNKESVT